MTPSTTCSGEEFSCLTCDPGYYLDAGGVCVTCTALSFCKTSLTSSACVGEYYACGECDSTFTLTAGSCVCLGTEYVANGHCNACPASPYCLSRNCTSADPLDQDCVTCEDGYKWRKDIHLCDPICGDGFIRSELCDDGNLVDGDGCTSSCGVQLDWSCTGEPSKCVRLCGNSVIETTEFENCDDGARISGDGCDQYCRIEPGYACTGVPSVCTLSLVCGNGVIDVGEVCDDGNTMSNDGCYSCAVEAGGVCNFLVMPTACHMTMCGDGLVEGTEDCDDGNPTSGDGCFNCKVEDGTILPSSAAASRRCIMRSRR